MIYANQGKKVEIETLEIQLIEKQLRLATVTTLLHKQLSSYNARMGIYEFNPILTPTDTLQTNIGYHIAGSELSRCQNKCLYLWLLGTLHDQNTESLVCQNFLSSV